MYLLPPSDPDLCTLEVGDTVMVEPGTDENKARVKNFSHDTSHSTNSLANTRWSVFVYC